MLILCALLITAAAASAGGCSSSDSTDGSAAATEIGFMVQVFDSSNLPLTGASVFVDGQSVTATSDASGTIRFSRIVRGSSVGVRVSKPDFMDSVQHISLPADRAQRLVVTSWLSPVGNSQSIDPSASSEVAHGGARAQIPPNSFVDSSGQPVTVPVQFSITYLPPGEDLRAAGTFSLDDDGDQALGSLGVVSVSATANGAPVTLALGASVRLSIPGNGKAGSAPPPLWKQDPSSGQWSQSPSAWTAEGSDLVAQADALATWNCDYPYRVTCATGSVVGPTGRPLAGVAVTAHVSGMVGISAVQAVIVGSTGSSGNYCVEAIPGGALKVAITCPGGGQVILADGTAASLEGQRCGGGACSSLGQRTACCFTDADCNAPETCQQGVCKPIDVCTLSGPVGECSEQDVSWACNTCPAAATCVCNNHLAMQSCFSTWEACNDGCFKACGDPCFSTPESEACFVQCEETGNGCLTGLCPDAVKSPASGGCYCIGSTCK